MKSIRLLLPAFVISGASWGIIITYLPLLLNERTTFPLPLIDFLVALWNGIGGLASLSYGRIRHRIDRKNVLLFSYLTIGFMSLLLAIFTHVIILLITLVFLGVSIFLSYPTLFSFVSEVTHESMEGWTFGITFTFQTGGGALLLFVGGVLADLFGIWIPFALLSMISLLFTLVLLVQYKKPFANQYT